jgi:translation initiation factor 2 beta subunit (eIF-2beta)/eIF-5
MARPPRHNVDYFPHYISDGKKMFIIESKYGNDGYAVWFKLLESLAKTDDHWMDLSDPANMMYLCAKCRVSNDIMESIINDLANLGEVDGELWKDERVIWSQKFIESIEEAYKKRSNVCPKRETVITKLRGLGRCKPLKCRSEGDVNPHTKVNHTKPKETKEEEEALPPPDHSLITWIKKNTPRVHQLKQPLTNEQAEKLIDDLEIDKGPRGEMLKDILTNMENYSPLLSKSVSANLTIRKWWKMELERNGEIQKPTTVAFIPNTKPHYK